MTILDKLEYLKERQYHPITGEYIGTRYTAHIEFSHAFMITNEAENRSIAEHAYEISLRKSREIMKTMLLKTAIEIIDTEHITSAEPKVEGIEGYSIPVVVLHDAIKPMFILPPKDYVPFLNAMKLHEENLRRRIYLELTS